MKTKGFSLIEILVVLAIFCFLLSLLMPALSKALKKMRAFEIKTYEKRSKPLLFVTTQDGEHMGFGLHIRSREPILYSVDEELKNKHLMLHILGFQKLREHVIQTPEAFKKPYKLSGDECELLEGCGFAEWRVWDEEKDWKRLIKQMSSAWRTGMKISFNHEDTKTLEESISS